MLTNVAEIDRVAGHGSHVLTKSGFTVFSQLRLRSPEFAHVFETAVSAVVSAVPASDDDPKDDGGGGGEPDCRV